MNDFDDSYRAVSLHIMAASLIVMMILDFMPFSFDGFFWLPEMTALMLLYWTLHQPQRAGMGLAFAIGLIALRPHYAISRCIGCPASQSGRLNCCPFVP